MKTPQEIGSEIAAKVNSSAEPANIQGMVAAAIQTERNSATDVRTQLANVLGLLAKESGMSVENDQDAAQAIKRIRERTNKTIKRLREALMDHICVKGSCAHIDCLDGWQLLHDTKPQV